MKPKYIKRNQRIYTNSMIRNDAKIKPAKNSEAKARQDEINSGSSNEIPTRGKKEQNSKTLGHPSKLTLRYTNIVKLH